MISQPDNISRPGRLNQILSGLLTSLKKLLRVFIERLPIGADNRESENSPAIAPDKRVNYTKGMLLTADDFAQEQQYFLARDDRHNRLLHGYGTVCGLHVRLSEPHLNATGIVVEPGIAVCPSGKVIHVPDMQEASLKAWLDKNRHAVAEQLARQRTPTLAVYVTLCYREQKVDAVPVPTSPGSEGQDSTTLTRIIDSFALSFSLEPPSDVEKEYTQRLVALLKQIDITAQGGPYLNEEAIANRVRALLEGPPEPNEALRIHPEQASTLKQVAFRVWVTEVHPNVPGNGCRRLARENCVFLATLEVRFNRRNQIEGPITINESNRPILLSTDLLEAWTKADW